MHFLYNDAFRILLIFLAIIPLVTWADDIAADIMIHSSQNFTLLSSILLSCTAAILFFMLCIFLWVFYSFYESYSFERAEEERKKLMQRDGYESPPDHTVEEPLTDAEKGGDHNTP